MKWKNISLFATPKGILFNRFKSETVPMNTDLYSLTARTFSVASRLRPVFICCDAEAIAMI